jgi:8-oxo-dGTP pyrophosphatase MutT (NUDIX family)
MEHWENSVKFKEWKKVLIKNNIKINSIEEKYSVHKRSGEILFSLLEIKGTDPDGIPLLPIVLLRGNFVSVVIAIKEKETNDKYFLLVKQRRVANGAVFYEHPAGMCDSESDPHKVALKEVEEETGLVLKKENLQLLWETPLYSSPGLLDEAGYFFYCDIELNSQELSEFKNKQTGAKDENEHIETFLCPSNDILKYIENSNGVLATLLYFKKHQL